MNKIGVQTKDVVYDNNPSEGFLMLKKSGFSCADFSLNSYLTNTDLYLSKVNSFFDKSEEELMNFFLPHKLAAKEAEININQMHMPYPIFVPNGNRKINDYLREVVATKSLKVCKFFDCKYIVVHGFKLKRYLGSEEDEWKETENFLDFIAPIAKDLEITICLENLYASFGNHIVEGPCSNVDKMVERIDRLNSVYGTELFGFCFDTGHANLIGLDFEKFITALGKRLKVLHIHDNDGVSDLHKIPFIFTKAREKNSTTDWPGFIRGLKNINFNGVLSFETAPVLGAFPDELKSSALSFIASIGDYFSNEISK